MAIPLMVSSKISEPNQFQIRDGWPEDWLDHGRGITRQLGNLGNYSFSRAKVSRFDIGVRGIPLVRGVQVFLAVQVKKNNAFNQLILIGEIEAGRHNLLHDLRSPGKQRTKVQIKSAFGLDVDDSNTVFATTVYSDNNSVISTRNALMYSDASNQFAFDISNSLIVSAVGAERTIVDNSARSLFTKDFLALQSRQNLNRLNNWINIPSSDSTQILEDMKLLRDSLNLDARASQVTKALATRTKSVDYSIATFFGSLGFANAALANLFDHDLIPPLSILTSVGIALFSSAVVYSIVRRG